MPIQQSHRRRTSRAGRYIRGCLAERCSDFGALCTQCRQQHLFWVASKRVTRCDDSCPRFAVWGGLFSTFNCSLDYIRGRHDAYNAIGSGMLAAGVLTARHGPRVPLPVPESNSIVGSWSCGNHRWDVHGADRRHGGRVKGAGGRARPPACAEWPSNAANVAQLGTLTAPVRSLRLFLIEELHYSRSLTIFHTQNFPH